MFAISRALIGARTTILRAKTLLDLLQASSRVILCCAQS